VIFTANTTAMRVAAGVSGAFAVVAGGVSIAVGFFVVAVSSQGAAEIRVHEEAT
jgi:hypothetical protein